jgi:hypothetical protein
MIDRIVCLEGNGYRQSHHGDGWKMGAMYTLNSTEVHAVCYSIGCGNSEAWLSDNPKAGIYETEICRTLDRNNCCYPACNQGGIAVVEIHQSGIPSARQPDQDSRR